MWDGGSALTFQLVMTRQGAETINSLTEFVQLAKPIVFFLFLILITYPLLTNNSGSYTFTPLCAPPTLQVEGGQRPRSAKIEAAASLTGRPCPGGPLQTSR